MLRRFLPSVVAHTPGADDAVCPAEVIVADNGSTDNSVEVLREEFPSVRVIELGHNYGFAEGYNRALAQIDTEYAVLLNSDVDTPEGWLMPMVEYMDSHTGVAAVQPRILSVHQPDHYEHAGAAGGEMDMLGYPFARGRIMDYVSRDREEYHNDYRCFWATGACMCVRTKIYKECGGLDADYFAHMEEIDLCWRMQCRGWEIACVGSSAVYHLGGGSLSYGNPRKVYLNFRNSLITLWKNLPARHLIYVVPLRCCMDYAAALNELVHGHGAAAWAIVRARMAVWQMLRPTLSKRHENQTHTTVPYPATISQRSIVWDYYIRHAKQ